MPDELVGTNAIEYYLKGRAIKEAREQRERQFQLGLIQRQIEANKLEAQQKQFDKTISETQRYHDAQIDKLKNDVKTSIMDAKIKGSKAFQEGLIDFDQEGNIIYTEKGAAAAAEAQKQGLIAEARNKANVSMQTSLNDIMAERAEKVAKAQLPSRSILQGQLFEHQDIMQQRALANTLEAARIRANATLENKNATKEEKNQAINDLIEGHKQDVFEGRRGLEDLPKGDVGNKVIGALLKNGKILTRKQIGQLEGFKSLQGFYEKTKQLNQLLQQGGLLNQTTNPQIKQLQDELAADLVIFGREAKAEKGVVTDKDIDRLTGAIPQLLPGGIRSITDKNARKEANDRRVKEIENLIHEKFDNITGPNINPAQKSAIRESYGIIKPIEKKKNTSVPDYLERVK